MTNKNTLLWVATLSLIVLLPVARAQEKQPEPAKPAATVRPAVQDEAPVLDDKSIKLFLDKIEVEGKLEKPQAIFIIPGMNPEVEDIRIERSFFDDIFRPIEKKGRAIVRPLTESDTRRKDVIPW